MKIVQVAGIPITTETKDSVVRIINSRLQQNQTNFIMTPYSEFLYSGFMNDEVKALFSRFDIAISDGISIPLADTFLSLPFRSKSFLGKVYESFYQMLVVLFWAIFSSNKLKKNIPEKIVGADFFLDCLKIAKDNNLKVFLLGGFDDTPKKVAGLVQEKFPGLQVCGFSNLGPDDPKTLEVIKLAKPDFLFVAYGPIVQEKFIDSYCRDLDLKLAMGVGGTFDYISGIKKSPPAFIRRNGFEWLFRLVTQRQRLKRIINATLGLIRCLVRLKVYESMPFRENVLCVIIKKDRVLLCKRKTSGKNSLTEIASDYWQFPQGGVEATEDFRVAALREAFEETGLKNLHLIKVSEKTHAYKWRNARRSLNLMSFGKKYHFKGQEQKMVFLENLDALSDVKLDNREFSDYKWLKVSDLEKVIHPERVEALRLIMDELKEIMGLRI